jgi:hypothetical protein
MISCPHCKQESTQQHYDRIVYGKTVLYGHWVGWRIAGRDIISPDGDRICPERLRGLLFTERNRSRGTKKRHQGNIVPFPPVSPPETVPLDRDAPPQAVSVLRTYGLRNPP